MCDWKSSCGHASVARQSARKTGQGVFPCCTQHLAVLCCMQTPMCSVKGLQFLSPVKPYHYQQNPFANCDHHDVLFSVGDLKACNSQQHTTTYLTWPEAMTELSMPTDLPVQESILGLSQCHPQSLQRIEVCQGAAAASACLLLFGTTPAASSLTCSVGKEP